MSDSPPPVPPVPPTPPVVPPAAAQPYSAQPYVAQPYAAQASTNTLAVVALIVAFFVPLAAIICGHIALGQIKRTGQGGHGLALAGTVLGYVFTGLGILFAIIYVVVIVAAVGAGGFSSHSG